MKGVCRLSLLMVVGCWLGWPMVWAQGEITLLDKGKPMLPVIFAAQAHPDERAAAEELARVLSKLAGVAWPLQRESPGSSQGIQVGATQQAREARARLTRGADLIVRRNGDVGPDAFRIFTQAGSIFIEVVSPEATAFAVSWFLQKEAGVRWYVPGALGEVVPSRKKWVMAAGDRLIQPAYVSRGLSGLESPEQRLWAERNGLRDRLEFNHALSRVIPQPLLAAYPEWGPELDGQLYQPTGDDGDRWQPNLALPEVAEVAAGVAQTAFARDPSRASISIAINDSMRFDQSPATQTLVRPLRFFRGMPDYSPLVFTFMNRVADRVEKTNPERYLGCLAYFWCENPPPFKVNSRVLPYITTDRSQYYNPEYREADLNLMTRWAESGITAFGLWDYGYGANFIVPRVPHRALADAIQEGWKRGARGYFSDMSPQPGFDGFKAWMLSQLLWQPETPVEELMEDFFKGYYGPAAAPMRRFFDGCETQWMKQSGSPFWLKLYQQEDQALVYPSAVCRDLRRHLTEAERLASNDEPVKARVALTSRAFAVTEAYVDFDDVRRSLAALDESDEGRLLATDAVVSEGIRRFLKTKRHLEDTFAAACSGDLPALRPSDLSYFTRNDPVPRLLWILGMTEKPRATALLANLDSSDEIPKTWRLLLERVQQDSWQRAEAVARNQQFEQIASALHEPRFLYPKIGALPAEWILRAMPAESSEIILKKRAAGSPGSVLRMAGAWDTQLFQWHPVAQDSVHVAVARMKGHASPGSDAALFLSYLSAEGKSVGIHRMQALPKGDFAAERTLVVVDTPPENAAWVGVGVGASRQTGRDWLEVASIELKVVNRTDDLLRGGKNENEARRNIPVRRAEVGSSGEGISF